MKKIYLIIATVLILTITAGCTKTFDVKIEYDTDMGTVEGFGEYEEGSQVNLAAIPNDNY